MCKRWEQVRKWVFLTRCYTWSIMSNFTIVFPRDTERLDYATLSDEIKQGLGEGVAQDPASHAVYRMCLFVKILPEVKSRKRERSRRAYESADRVLVNLMTPNMQVKLCGIFPPTETVKFSGSGEGEITAGVTTPAFTVNLHGMLKDLARRKGQHVLAGHSDHEAQWVFLKPYLEEHTDFYLTVLLEISPGMPAESRFVWCGAEVLDMGRSIQTHRWRRIHLHE